MGGEISSVLACCSLGVTAGDAVSSPSVLEFTLHQSQVSQKGGQICEEAVSCTFRSGCTAHCLASPNPSMTSEGQNSRSKKHNSLSGSRKWH